MGKDSQEKNLKESGDEKGPAKKLDFLLDTIDTEVADLADVVDVEGPILDDETTNQEAETVDLDDTATGADSPELDMDLFDERTEQEVETESTGNRAQAALDAMNDTEGEIEAMLGEAGSVSEDKEIVPGEVSGTDEIDRDLDQALEELLATREVDVSKLIENIGDARVGNERETSKSKQGESVKTAADHLSDDLFEDLDRELEIETGDLGNKDQTSPEEDIFQEPVDDLELDPEVEKEDEKDLSDTEFQGPGQEIEESDGEAATSSTTSDEQLAGMLSLKIEALVTKVVEERLAEIAERVIKDKIDKIFSSMK